MQKMREFEAQLRKDKLDAQAKADEAALTVETSEAAIAEEGVPPVEHAAASTAISPRDKELAAQLEEEAMLNSSHSAPVPRDMLDKGTGPGVKSTYPEVQPEASTALGLELA